MREIMNEKRALLGPVATVFGSEHTGAWRVQRPVVDSKRCTFCGECQKYCPVDVVEIRDDDGNRVLSINLSYCKGCSICVEICARHAMSMVPERTQP